MAFTPRPGSRIKLDGSEIEFTPLEERGPASAFLYAEDGKEATVYRVKRNGSPYALKVFYPEYQNVRLIGNSAQLSRFKTFEGLRVAERIIITKHAFPQLLRAYPELEYAVLMPWIQGNIWGNVYTAKRSLSSEQFLQIAKSLVCVVNNLETKGLAHCDLSNNNFIFNESRFSVELIDIENLFAPNMPHPIPDISYGTKGYRTSWIAEKGLWSPIADRFACAILCAEILTWHIPEVRQERSGDTSYFDEEEIGTNSKRYLLVRKHLMNINSTLGSLFEKAWTAHSLEECPKISEWKDVIEKIGSLQCVEGSENLKKNEPKLDKPIRTVEFEGASVIGGTPPNMIIDYPVLTFSLGDHAVLSITFSIRNDGGVRLSGSIFPEPYLRVSPDSVSIDPGGKCDFVVSLKKNLPKPQSRYEFRSASGLVIETNAGHEVVGITIKYPKKGLFN